MYIDLCFPPMSSLPHASYCPCTCTYLRLPPLNPPGLPCLTCLTCLTCLCLPPPAFAWPCSAFSALPGLAYPPCASPYLPLCLSCIVRSCPALLVFVLPCIASSGLACFACLVFLCSFCSFVPLLAFCALVLGVPVFRSKNVFLSLPTGVISL